MNEFVYNPEECTDTIEIDLDDETLLVLARAAHERDITLNHLINESIYYAIKNYLENNVEK